MKEGNFYSKKETIRIISLSIVTYIILCVFVIVFPYEIKDPDSQVYSKIGQQLAYTPIKEWCAPLWQGHENNPLHPTLFQDHPPGIFWFIALFVRAGIPSDAASLCVNFLFIFLSLYFLFRFVSYFGDSFLGWAAVYGYLFTPVFLLYLVRANQEHPLNLAIIAGVYAFVRSDESFKYKALFIISLVFAVLIKGMAAFILTALVLLYWVLFLRKAQSLLTIVFAILFTMGVMYLFELWYQNITSGVGFWKNYIYFQGSAAAMGGFNPLNKIYNFFWYLARAIWFPAPLVFFVPYGIYTSKKNDKSLLRDKFFRFCLFSTTLIIIWFSLFDRKADRYIFSSYCLLVLLGIWTLIYLKPCIIQYLKKINKLLPFYLSLALIIFTLLRIYFHTYHPRLIKF